MTSTQISAILTKKGADIMKCNLCNGNISIQDSSIIYGKSYGYIHICDSCGAFVGCHPNSKIALGTVANTELRELRKTCHKYFDVMWKSGRVSRTGAYKWLQKSMQLSPEEAHIGMFDVDKCKKLLRILSIGKDDVMKFGKYKGWKIKDVPKSYLDWCERNNIILLDRS